MARLPDVTPDMVDPAPVSTGVVQPTDFNLDRVGQELRQPEALAQRNQIMQIRAQAQADREAAVPYLQKLQNANQDYFQASAAAYTGAPGFASDQIATAADRAQRFATDPNMTPGQQSEFSRLALQETQRIGNQAIQHEATVQAKPIAEAAQNQQNAQLGDAVSQASQITMPMVQAAFLNHTPGATDLVANVNSAYKTDEVGAIRAGLPANLQPAFDAQMLSMQQSDTAKALAHTLTTAQQGVQDSTARSIGTLANSVETAPTGYDNAVTQLPTIIAGLPAGLQQAAMADGQAQLAQGRIKGLINQGHANVAQDELKSGKYNAIFTPQELDALTASADAAARDHAPRTLDQALAQQSLRQSADAQTYAYLTTGKGAGVNLDAVAAQLGPEEAARYQAQWTNAQKAFAAVGPIRDMPSGQVAALASAAPPDPSDPAYASKLPIWQAQQQAAQAELKSRQDPGAWAFASNGKAATKGPGAAAVSLAQDRGAALQGMWASVLQNGDANHVGASYAGSMLGAQAGAGIPASARQMVPQTEAARLAATVINASPDQRAAAMASLATTVNALPASFQMPDGSIAAPRAILAKQLLAAHMTPVELSAIVDFGSDPAKLGRVVAALNDPTIKAPLPHGQQAQFTATIKTAMAPFLSSVAPLPDAGILAQARLDRTALVARELMATQHMSPPAAARAAAADVTSGYRYVDTWRMPAALAGGVSVNLTPGALNITDGAGYARRGAAQMLAALTAQNGKALYAPGGLPGDPDQQRQVYAAQVQHNARWVTTPDDGGLALMVPHPDGTWDQVADRYGRPVRANWNDLQALGQGRGQLPFMTPPPTAVQGPNGQPVPAFSKSAAFGALSWAVNGQESHFRSGLVSGKGALGQMGITPDTVQTYAPRLGLPVDLDRAQNDDGYNRAIGNAALSDNINHYGASGAGIGLALAAYNAGRGRLEGYTDKTGYHPGWLTTIGDPRTGQISLTDFVKRIPYGETRNYVQTVLPAALGKLQGAN